jgi:hypothetical protein
VIAVPITVVQAPDLGPTYSLQSTAYGLRGRPSLNTDLVPYAMLVTSTPLVAATGRARHPCIEKGDFRIFWECLAQRRIASAYRTDACRYASTHRR